MTDFCLHDRDCSFHERYCNIHDRDSSLHDRDFILHDRANDTWRYCLNDLLNVSFQCWHLPVVTELSHHVIKIRNFVEVTKFFFQINGELGREDVYQCPASQLPHRLTLLVSSW